ncbi:MAG: hypothetical protein OIN85_02130 [Candidatus Methanoperedens sp.]|nr:hypothetical protein [Candidatus Methanoperedens sp.]
MKIVHILLVLILAASALGCVGNKPSEVTPTPTTPATQVETSVSPTETPVSAAATTTPSNDQFGTQSDLSTIDSLVNDSSMDIPLYDVNI